VPDYQIRKVFWADGHFEGRYLFQDTLLVEMVAPTEDGGSWQVKFAWQSLHSGPPTENVTLSRLRKGKLELLIPVETMTHPGIKGNIRLIASEWNATF
jgi:hypothetical protein